MLNPGSMGQLELSLVRTFVGLMSRDICIGGGASARIALPKCQDKLLDLYIERAAEMEERTPYYGVVWPSAVGLARAVGAHVRDGDRVLELGCGLGLGGIASALTANPSQVLLTDYDPAAVRLARMSAKLSRVSHVVRSAPIDWNYRPSWASHGLSAASFDVAIAADVIYEPEACAPVAAVLAHALRPGGRFLLADSEPRLHRARLRSELCGDGRFIPLQSESRVVEVVSSDHGSANANGPSRVVLQSYERTEAV